MGITNLRDLFLHGLSDALSAERQILKALPQLSQVATSDSLQSEFLAHMAVTEAHIERLDRIFRSLDESPEDKHCIAMEGLLTESEELIEEHEAGPALDAALICNAQKVEHLEIALYGTLVTYARMLDAPDAADLLAETLAEEKEADESLTALAYTINHVAGQKVTR